MLLAKDRFYLETIIYPFYIHSCALVMRGRWKQSLQIRLWYCWGPQWRTSLTGMTQNHVSPCHPGLAPWGTHRCSIILLLILMKWYTCIWSAEHLLVKVFCFHITFIKNSYHADCLIQYSFCTYQGKSPSYELMSVMQTLGKIWKCHRLFAPLVSMWYCHWVWSVSILLYI